MKKKKLLEKNQTLEITLDEFGTVRSNIPMDEIYNFLNSHHKDKKLKKMSKK